MSCKPKPQNSAFCKKKTVTQHKKVVFTLRSTYGNIINMSHLNAAELPKLIYNVFIFRNGLIIEAKDGSLCNI